MAAPLFNLNYSVINNCDADDWDGGAGILDPDIKKQGTNALSIAVRDSGDAGVTGTWDMSGTDVHIRLWFMHTFPSYLETKALGGIQLWVSDGTNTNYYYVGGSDTHTGSYELMQADLASPDVGGSVNLAAVTSAGWEIVHAVAARNITNTWWDYFVFGTGYEIYGGTSGDKITWETLAIADKAAGYGMVVKDKGVYFLNGELAAGDSLSTNDCYFDGSGEVAVFYSANESATLYKLKGTGNATGTTSIDVAGSVIKAEAQQFLLDVSSANITAGVFTGAGIENARSVLMASGQTVEGVVIRKCGAADTNGASLTASTITDTTEDTTGSLLVYSAAEGNIITDMRFLSYAGNSRYAIYVSAEVTAFTMDNWYFDSATSYALYWAGTSGTLTVSATNGTNIALSGCTAAPGGTIVVSNPRIKTFTGLPTNTEIRVRQGSYTLAHQQDVISGSYAFNYSPSGDAPAVAQFTLPGYVIEPIDILLDSTDQTLPVTVKNDPSYQ